MSKIRLTAESSNYYIENKSNTPSRRHQQFVSYIQDDESNQESDGSISNTFNDDPHVGVTPVNLFKRLSNITPDRVLQLALEDKDKVVDQARGGDSYTSNDKQTAEKNNVKALKSRKTKKNQTGKEPSLNYNSGDAEISEPKIMDEETKPRITRRRGVKITTQNAGKTQRKKLASEASKSIDEEAASRMLDKKAPDGAILPDLKQKRGRQRKIPEVANGSNLNVIDKEPVNDTPLRSDILSSISNKATAFSEQDSDVVSSSESDDEDAIFSTRSTTLQMGTSKSSTQLKAFLTPDKNAEMLSSPETMSDKGSTSQYQPSNSSDSSASVPRTPRRLSFNFTTTPKGRQTVHKDRITSSHTEKNTMRLSPVLSPPTDKSSWVERTAAITSPVPMASSHKSPMKLGSAGEKVTLKKTLSKVTLKKTIPQNISLSSYPKENNVQLSEETSALKRKSSTNITSPLTPNKRQRRRLNESGKTSVNSGMHSSDTVTKKTRQNQKRTIANQLATENGDTANIATVSVMRPGPGENRSRYNPYLAPSDDVLRARSLMSTEEYRVTWLYLEPKSVFTLKTFAPTTLIIVSGSIRIKIDETPLINLNKKSLTTVIGVGHRCIITNTGNTTAIFQTTENFEIS